MQIQIRQVPRNLLPELIRIQFVSYQARTIDAEMRGPDRCRDEAGGDAEKGSLYRALSQSYLSTSNMTRYSGVHQYTKKRSP
jgi:hypothetical protein